MRRVCRREETKVVISIVVTALFNEPKRWYLCLSDLREPIFEVRFGGERSECLRHQERADLLYLQALITVPQS